MIRERERDVDGGTDKLIFSVVPSVLCATAKSCGRILDPGMSVWAMDDDAPSTNSEVDVSEATRWGLSGMSEGSEGRWFVMSERSEESDFEGL